MSDRGRSIMGSAARTKARTTREKVAASRTAQRRAEVRRRVLLAGGSVAVVLALVGTLIAVKLGQSPGRPAPAAPAAAPGTTAQVQRQVISVPPAAFDAVGAGTATGLT